MNTEKPELVAWASVDTEGLWRTTHFELISFYPETRTSQVFWESLFIFSS